MKNLKYLKEVKIINPLIKNNQCLNKAQPNITVRLLIKINH
jgi:hypothetical protein